LAVNKGKTKYMIFRTKGKKLPDILPELIFDENETNCPFNPNLVTTLESYHNNHPNADSRSYKLLGILFDEHLSFDYHVNHLTRKLSKSMFCIRMAKNNLNPSGLRSLYFALVHSHLSYCPIILNCLSKTNLNRLEKVQKKAIRIITNSKYNAHTAPLFIEKGILPIDKIIKMAKLSFMHSIYYDYAPRSFEQVWTRNIDRQNDHHLRNENDFSLPNPRLEQFKRFPIYSLPFEWNNAGVLTFYDNKTTFKIALKNQLFEEILGN
jgi:hypothetical protein